MFRKIFLSGKSVTLLAVVSQYLGILAVFKLLAAGLDAGTFAKYVLFIAGANLLLGLPFTAIQQAISKYVPAVGVLRSQHYVAAAIKQTVVILLVFAALLPLLRLHPGLDDAATRYHANLVIVYALSESLKLYVQAYENARQHRASYLALILVEYVLKVAISAALLGTQSATIFEVIEVLIFSNTVVVLVWAFHSRFRWRVAYGISLFKSRYSSRLMLFALPMACWSVFGWLRDMSGRYVVEAILVREDVAAFAVMGTLTSLVPGFIFSVVASYYAPVIYASRSDEPRAMEKRMNKILLGMVAMLVGVVAASFLGSHLLVVIVADQKYLRIAEYLPYTLVAYSVYTVSMMATTELYAKGRVGVLFLPNLLSGLLGVTVLYFWTQAEGFIGAVKGYAVGYVTYGIVTLALISLYRRKSA